MKSVFTRKKAEFCLSDESTALKALLFINNLRKLEKVFGKILRFELNLYVDNDKETILLHFLESLT